MSLLTQRFDYSDIFVFPILIFMDAFLSLDNIFAIGLLSKKMDSRSMKIFCFLGSFISLVGRFVFISILSRIHIFWLYFLSGGYLIFLSIRSIFGKDFVLIKSVRGLISLEIVDLIFTIDSTTSSLGIITAHYYYPRSKLWMIYLSGIINVIFVRFLIFKLYVVDLPLFVKWIGNIFLFMVGAILVMRVL